MKHARQAEEPWRTTDVSELATGGYPRVHGPRTARAGGHDPDWHAGRLVRALGRTSGPDRPEDPFEIEIGGTVMAVTRADIDEVLTR